MESESATYLILRGWKPLARNGGRYVLLYNEVAKQIIHWKDDPLDCYRRKLILEPFRNWNHNWEPIAWGDIPTQWADLNFIVGMVENDILANI